MRLLRCLVLLLVTIRVADAAPAASVSGAWVSLFGGGAILRIFDEGRFHAIIQERGGAMLFYGEGTYVTEADEIVYTYQSAWPKGMVAARSTDREKILRQALMTMDLRLTGAGEFRFKKIEDAKSRPFKPAVGQVVVGMAELDEPPKRVGGKSPTYPMEFRRGDGFQGSVVEEFLIDPTGKVQRARAIAFNHGAFAKAIDEVADTWRFSPPQKDGKPVAARMVMFCLFTLKD